MSEKPCEVCGGPGLTQNIPRVVFGQLFVMSGVWCQSCGAQLASVPLRIDGNRCILELTHPGSSVSIQPKWVGEEDAQE